MRMKPMNYDEWRQSVKDVLFNKAERKVALAKEMGLFSSEEWEKLKRARAEINQILLDMGV